MGSISSKSLNKNDELDELLDEEDEVEEEDIDEELDSEEDEEEEVFIPKSKKRRLKKQQKQDNNVYVMLNTAATYTLDGQTFKCNEMVQVPRSKAKKFKDNGWFTVRD